MPALAVTTTNGHSTVMVATDGTADGPTETRTVTTGGRSGAMIEITSGLPAATRSSSRCRPAFANRTGGEGGGGFGGGEAPAAAPARRRRLRRPAAGTGGQARHRRGRAPARRRRGSQGG